VKLMPSKKIILFIVEGVTDQTCLGSVLSRLLDSYEIRFELIRTDITIANGADTGNIVSRIGDAVKHFCGKIYKRSDIYEVIHLIDTDGAYISEEKVIYAIASKFGWISLQRVFRPLGFDVPPDIGNASWVPGGA
jgi:hypothetical protein